MSKTEQKITRDDLESKLVELQTGIDNAISSSRDVATKIGIVAAVLILILVFVLGRRRGRMARTVVEIRRI